MNVQSHIEMLSLQTTHIHTLLDQLLTDLGETGYDFATDAAATPHVKWLKERSQQIGKEVERLQRYVQALGE